MAIVVFQFIAMVFLRTAHFRSSSASAPCARSLRVLLAQTVDEAFRRIAFTVLFVLPITITHFFHIERQYPVRPRFDQCGRPHRVPPVPLALGIGALSTARALDGSRVKRGTA